MSPPAAVASEPAPEHAARQAARQGAPVRSAPVSRSVVRAVDRTDHRTDHRTGGGPHLGSDEPADDRSGRLAEREERRAHDIAEAATWRVDPALVEPQPTDGVATATARAQLAVVAEEVRQQVASYDAARERASRAAAAARRARADLRAARDSLAAARARYDADRKLLVSVLTEDYTRTQLAPLAALLTSDENGTLPSDLTMLEEMGRIQDGTVRSAARSRARLGAAEQAYEAVAAQAALDLRTASAAVAAATQARDAVLAELDRARSLVTESVLADLAARALAAREAREARAAREQASGGYRGRFAFPLAPGTPFTDLDNFGGRSEHWATQHTGDDFSTACGSPVVAANDGVVVIRTDQGWSGRWLVMVSTAPGSLTTWYAHMQEIDVVDGQAVHAGDSLGQVGEEGNASGCHLHFEVHPTGGGIYEDDTDPGTWLQEVGAYPSGS